MAYINRALRTLAATAVIGAAVATGAAQDKPNSYTTAAPRNNQTLQVQNREYLRLSEIENPYPDQTPIYLPLNGKRTVQEAIVMGTGILDDALITKLEKEFQSEHGWNSNKPKPNSSGVVCYTKEKIPENYRAGDVILDPETLDAKEWPEINLEAELNIPAFRWRIYQKIKSNGQAVGGDEKILLADWPVIVGNPFGGKYYAPTPLGKNEIYAIEHFPDYDEGHYNKKTKKWVRIKHVDPGKRSNPFQEWKFLYKPGTGFYFHGTNMEKLLSRKRRMFSHGCVRNYNWNMDMLSAVVLRNEGKLDVHDRTCGHRKGQDWNKFYRLKHPIPALNVYDTIEVFAADDPEKGYVAFYPNVYRYNAWKDDKSPEMEFVSLTTVQHLKDDLEKIGYDLTVFDEQKMNSVVKKMRNIRYAQTVLVKDFLN